MQIYADILNREFHVAASSQTAALGSAIYGATAAGSENGGYDTVAEAAAAMHCGVTAVYRPDPEAHAVYDRLYREYLRLVDLFGNASDSMLTRLRTIRMESLK